MSNAPVDATPTRTAALLDAALEVFLRYGFRKTSMGDVASAAGLSRQGLYLHFETKETLFRASMNHALESMRRDVEACLSDAGVPLADRLLAAFCRITGPFVGKIGPQSFDVMEMSRQLNGDVIEKTMAALQARMTDAIDLAVSPVAGSTVTARDRVTTLFAASAGLKHKVDTPRAFSQAMRKVIAVALEATSPRTAS